MSDKPPSNHRATERLTVSEAAARLGITESAVRGRINRGTLEAERDEGTVYVLLSGDYSSDYPGADNALTSALEERIRSLEAQLERAEERDRENRRLLAAALERIPPQLEPPSEAQETEESPTPERRGFWSRLFGG